MASVFSRYFHFFWIPVIPLGKYSVTQCGHCKQVLSQSEMPAAYRAPVAAEQSKARLPVSNYLVLILLGIGLLFITGAGLFGGKTSTATSALASSSTALPQAGAVYSMPMGEGRHSLMQVTKTTADSLYFRITDPLQTPATAANLAGFLRDSVAPANAATRYSKEQWKTVLRYNKELTRLR